MGMCNGGLENKLSREIFKSISISRWKSENLTHIYILGVKFLFNFSLSAKLLYFLYDMVCQKQFELYF